ncbi:phospholipase D/nuclease [Bimuria novae-zelandiae CBS 107.79]|uniref:Phospholipase D/nuclease n=1 Tax=Bimuria novae-zelandiae CBS 107.79 TaxID=1447943 RepID=A0A6A5VTE2_9PLEO|nr:phospholipase D/nuclease [Bimuria novae-zelandiae CBS 107.79]
MKVEHEDDSPPNKRRKLELDVAAETGSTPSSPSNNVTAGKQIATSLQRPISPPASRRRRSRTPPPSTPRVEADAHVTKQTPTPNGKELTTTITEGTYVRKADGATTRVIASPIQLTKIRDLGSEQNVDTVELRDLLGDPMIKECWNFNFLFDLDFVMKHFDPDVRHMVKVKIVHGFWKSEDANRINLMEVAERYPNIQLISACMPDPFGTHHSKMLILLRHDDTAQLIIHTANMIERDWGNMTQGVWRSPLLPLLQPASSNASAEGSAFPIGSGERFKKDLFSYLNAYGKRISNLTEVLLNYDFSAIRAAFLGSVPSRQKPGAANPSLQTSFGWLGLKEILSSIPSRPSPSGASPNLIVQVSSIATLGADTKWLKNFQSVLSKTASPPQPSTPFTKASSLPKGGSGNADLPLSLIFPTAPEIRASLDGYASGSSIHTKLSSPAQQKQLAYLRPLLCHWTSHHLDFASSSAVPDSALMEKEAVVKREAHRGPAAPHIKTYIRFADAERSVIDWAMLTSANLSKQAWGDVLSAKEKVWVQSYEVGVVVWPGLFLGRSREGPGEKLEGEGECVMVPVFGRDGPGEEDVKAAVGGVEGKKTVVGWRLPYDLPLMPYGVDESPWCATLADDEPDWMGRAWRGYQSHR